MLFDPQSPVFQAAVAPFLISFVFAGALTLFASGEVRSSFAVCGAGLAIVAAYWLALSWPPFPPRASTHKLGYLIVLSTLLSLLLANRSLMARIAPAAAYLVAIIGIGWIAESRIAQGQLVGVGLTAILGAIAVFGLSLRRDEPVDNGVAILVAAFALAGITFLGNSASIMQLSLAVAPAIGGFLVWTWPRRRLGFSEVGIVAVALPLIWLASQAALYTRANTAALAILVAVAFAPAIRAALLRQPALNKDALRPVATGVVAVVIGAVALAIVFFAQSGQSGYAY